MAIEVHSILQSIGLRVRTLRNQKDWTGKTLADQSGVSQRFLADVETGRANISIAKLAAIANGLEVPITTLFGDGSPGGATRQAIDELLDGRQHEELLQAHRTLAMTLGAKKQTPIALLGLRGAGKSTVGPQLAQRLERQFVELDEHIEVAAGLALSEIFAVHGEGYYRRLETQCLQSLIEQEATTVIALSGGVVHNGDAFELVQRRCTSVWLKATPDDHMQRVLDQGDSRPMAHRDNAMAELRTLLATREPLYEQSHFTIDTTVTNPTNAVETLCAALSGRG